MELFQNYPDIHFVKIHFDNKDKKFPVCKDENIVVVRNLSQHLKTIQLNNRRVRLKTFYNFIHQDYDVDGEPISRPYIITEKDVSFFFFFTFFYFLRFLVDVCVLGPTAVSSYVNLSTF